MDNVTTLTDQNWQAEVLDSKQPVLVDFWAEWCAPCKTLSPIVESIAAQYAGRLKVGKFDVAESVDVPVRYNIQILPTLLVLKGGMVAEQRVGTLSKDALAKLVAAHLD